MAVEAPDIENALQGDFGESWLQAVAAGCGLLHGRPTTVDLEKADVQLTQRGVVDGTCNPTVQVQVKTDSQARGRESNSSKVERC